MVCFLIYLKFSSISVKQKCFILNDFLFIMQDRSTQVHHLRAIILKIQDYLSDHDRKCLHFFLGPDVPRRIRDDPSLGGTLNLMESLFDQERITERDFTFLINAFDEIRCLDAVEILRGEALVIMQSLITSISLEHMRRMQANGQHESLQSLTSILLDDLNEREDKYERENSE